jgi:putative flippase GtrA
MADELIKVIKAAPAAKPKLQDRTKLLKFYLIGLVGASLGFVALLLLVSYLNMPGYIKTTSLLLGAFLIFDIHHSLKFYVNRSDN